MNKHKLQKQIYIRKKILNFFLLFFKRTNLIVVILSQNLDFFIQKEQEALYTSYTKKNKTSNSKIA
ncbi:MAG: hypothetical protein ACRCYE_10610 [Sarcina sp.]